MIQQDTLRLILIVSSTAILWTWIGIEAAFGQQTTTAVTTQEPQPAIGGGEIATVGIGTAAGLIAIVQGLLNQRKNTKRDRTTDVDAGRFIILISKFYQAKYLYPHMTDKEILDLPISNNPMSKLTLGNAITSEAELWANGNQQYWGIPSPQMSVPTMTTVDAIKSKDEYPKVVVSADTQKSTAKPQTPGTVANQQPAQNTASAAPNKPT